MPGLNIETLDDQLSLERVVSFRGGADSFNAPELLPQDTSQIIENMLVPDNFVLQTRYGADRIGGSGAPSVSKIQGLAWFDNPTNGQFIVTVSNALLSSYSGSAWAAIAGWTPTANTSQVEMAQAIDNIYFTDGNKAWGFWTGTGAATTLGTTYGTGVGIGDPPVGASIIAWNGTRMFAAGLPFSTPNKTTPDTLMVSLALVPGNGGWDNVTWSIRIGSGDSDPITALAPMQNNWLLVLKKRSLWLVYADPTATSAGNYTVQNLTKEIGCVGKRAWAMNGNDVMFLAHDGIRSVRRMAIGVDEFEVVPPMSEPIKSYIDSINWLAASKTCAWRYLQWVFFAIPTGAQDDTKNPDTVLVFNTRTQTWMGAFTGWAPTCWATTYFNGSKNLIYGDTTPNVNQWKDDQDTSLATTCLDNGVAVASYVRTKVFTFQDPVATKDPMYLEVRAINSQVNFTATAYTDDTAYPLNLFETATSQLSLPAALPWTLGSSAPFTARRSLDSIPDFNQLYLEFNCPTGFLTLKNFTIGAFLNTIDTDEIN